MATLTEVQAAAAGGTGTTQTKVLGACLMAAQAVIYEATDVQNHTNRLIWAQEAFRNLPGVGAEMLKAVIALAQGNNTEVTAAELSDLPDATIQDYVNAAINTFATGA